MESPVIPRHESLSELSPLNEGRSDTLGNNPVSSRRYMQVFPPTLEQGHWEPFASKVGPRKGTFRNLGEGEWEGDDDDDDDDLPANTNPQRSQMPAVVLWQCV